ncbi:hypothetical protein [Roseisolibacter sp. H3M3-2]|uniref:hypothetical protein n=1 Tax=Roseisolibacter sp. H3M3-2 TaxID=3031323 RepID=UPI0023DAC4A4|nr:hypothetical protein [Roseisolibacter sp. H3M3-2]MDF1502927.1 hypothetical protein [Roseisolibacter sp. H3M3-2]
MSLSLLHVVAIATLNAVSVPALPECSPRLSVDERAHCVLVTPAGEKALAAIGQNAPADAPLEVRQAHAALVPSFARYVIRTAGVAAAQEALSRATPDAYPKYTGRSLAQWRTDWVASIGGTAVR